MLSATMHRLLRTSREGMEHTCLYCWPDQLTKAHQLGKGGQKTQPLLRRRISQGCAVQWDSVPVGARKDSVLNCPGKGIQQTACQSLCSIRELARRRALQA